MRYGEVRISLGSEVSSVRIVRLSDVAPPTVEVSFRRDIMPRYYSHSNWLRAEMRTGISNISPNSED